MNNREKEGEKEGTSREKGKKEEKRAKILKKQYS